MSKSIKDNLLQLSDEDKKERMKALSDLLFYNGKCDDVDVVKLLDIDLMGQSWITTDDLDYIPSQVIDNKVKPLINKQARFMFGRRPDILFKPLDVKDNDECEALRQYIDAILNASKFWSITLKAFRLATITKRVLLRMEANPGTPIRLYYHSVNDFNYETDPNDITKLLKVVFVKQDVATRNNEIDKQLWYRYTYYLDRSYEKESCFLKTETFKGNNQDTPIKAETVDTKLSKIPCWVLCNEQSLESPIGISDIKDLRPLQDAYNRRLSDFNDCLRFLMFGQTAIIDATEETVNNCKIAPNSTMALESLEGKTASAQRVESNFTNSEPVRLYLQTLEDSMYEKLAIPQTEELQKVPSAKTIKYIYTELVARCEEKWHDWEPIFRSMIRLIVEACTKFKCYEDWREEWGDLLYNIILIKNYPIPEDEEDKKRLAIEEVQNNVRSHRSYIKDYSNDEDVKKAMKEICEDVAAITNAESDPYTQRVADGLSKYE